MLRCASLQSIDSTVLDSDAFYCTNMERFAEDAQSISKGEVLLLPEQGFEVGSLVPLLSSKRQILIIDDLNSLYSLASDGRKSQQLTILMKLLSHNARMNGSWAIATAYRAELDHKQSAMNQRSLTALGDLLVDTETVRGLNQAQGRASRATGRTASSASEERSKTVVYLERNTYISM